MAEEGPMDWFARQPVITKWLMVVSIVIPLVCGFVPVFTSLVVWHAHSIVRRFQLWRCLTNFFFAKLDFGLLMSLFMRARYSYQLETSAVFERRPADYLWTLIMIMVIINVANGFFGMAVLWDSLSTAIIHYWAQLNKTVMVTFMFGIRFPAVYLPWVLAIVSFLMGANFWASLLGIFAAHAIYTVNYVQDLYGLRRFVLFAPSWLHRLVPSHVYQANVSSEPKPAAAASSDAGFVAFRGSSNRLGKE